MSAAETRSQIVEAADRSSMSRGFEHTAFSAIAKAVELSKGNISYHFKTKDGILAAVIEARPADTPRMLASLKDSVGNLDERRLLIMMVRQPPGERFVREPQGVRFVCSSSS